MPNYLLFHILLQLKFNLFDMAAAYLALLPTYIYALQCTLDKELFALGYNFLISLFVEPFPKPFPFIT